MSGRRRRWSCAAALATALAIGGVADGLRGGEAPATAADYATVTATLRDAPRLEALRIDPAWHEVRSGAVLPGKSLLVGTAAYPVLGEAIPLDAAQRDALIAAWSPLARPTAWGKGCRWQPGVAVRALDGRGDPIETLLICYACGDAISAAHADRSGCYVDFFARDADRARWVAWAKSVFARDAAIQELRDRRDADGARADAAKP